MRGEKTISGEKLTNFRDFHSPKSRGAFQLGLGNCLTLDSLALTHCTLCTPPERPEKAGPRAAAGRLDILRSLSTEIGYFDDNGEKAQSMHIIRDWQLVYEGFRVKLWPLDGDKSCVSSRLLGKGWG